jgi:holo-[acyl-carrier protein] synthase
MVRIVGHGVDLVDLVSLEQLRHRDHFDERCFTNGEREDGAESPNINAFLAGRFAAKEAILKALSTGLIDGIAWHDIEVRRAQSGAPSVRLSGGVGKLAAAQGVTDVFISISHTESVAMASAITVTAA